MDRVTGSYKRWAKRWVIIIAIVVVCACNVDSIAIARALYAGGAVRAAVVQQATDRNFCSTPNDQARCALEARNVLEATGIPLGWSAPKSPRRCLGLAAEDSRPADIGRCGGAWRTLLVSPAGPRRNATQYRTSPNAGLLASFEVRRAARSQKRWKPALLDHPVGNSPALAHAESVVAHAVWSARTR